MPDTQAPGFFRYRLGDFRAISLHEGVLTRDRPDGFVPGVADDIVAEAFAEAGMPRDKLTLTFNPLAVETPDGLVLIDTGFGTAGPPSTGRLLGNLRAAGYEPADVRTVIISHFHGDHILGLRDAAGAPTFPAARLLVPKAECDFWLDDATAAAAPDAARPNFELARKIMTGLERQTFAWGEEILPGFRAVDAGGHTPGMTAIEITSAGESLLYVADVTNNPLIFARHPEWKAMFDVDGDRTLQTRRRIFDRAVAERLRLHFFHAPFPATAFLAKSGDAYAYLPALWQADG